MGVGEGKEGYRLERCVGEQEVGFGRWEEVYERPRRVRRQSILA